MSSIYKQIIIPEALTGYRLDQALAILCKEFSRAYLQHWIREGKVEINGKIITRPSSKITAQQNVVINATLPEKHNWSAESMPLNVVYEDQDIIVVNKPAGLVVHPGAGNKNHTLVNSLLYYDNHLATLPRAGLIHRLDKETSGLLVVARNMSSFNYLVKALQAREIQRIYQAVVHGHLISGGTIDAAIGRHSKHRTKMSVKINGGKSAITHYRILNHFQHYTHIEVRLETGRTHQIRTHFAYIKHPLVGDPVYGKSSFPKGKLCPELIAILKTFKRQALHASCLSFKHPTTGIWMNWQAPLPQDMHDLLAALTSNLNL